MRSTGRDYLAPEHFCSSITRLKAILLQRPYWGGGGSSVKTILKESGSDRFTPSASNFHFHCVICATSPFA